MRGLLAICLGGWLVPLQLMGADNRAQTAQVENQPGVIGPDDTVTIVALNVDEISHPWRVDSEGILTLPMVGRIRVAGMRPPELEKEIVSRLSPYVLTPQVTVFVSDVRSHPVTISGAVG